MVDFINYYPTEFSNLFLFNFIASSLQRDKIKNCFFFFFKENVLKLNDYSLQTATSGTL